MSEVYYRVDRILYHACDCDDVCHHPARPAMTVTQYYVIKRTPKGVWLSLCEEPMEPGKLRCSVDTPRFVLSKSTKKFACPTLVQAYESFMHRKVSQKRHLERELYYTKELIKQADMKYIEMRKEHCSKCTGAEDGEYPHDECGACNRYPHQ